MKPVNNINYTWVDAVLSLLPLAKVYPESETYAEAEWAPHEDRIKPTVKEVEDELARLIAIEPMEILREERNLKLAETDWWASTDLTITQEQKDYRQELRDLPLTASPELDSDRNLDGTANLTSVTWPTKPS